MGMSTDDGHHESAGREEDALPKQPSRKDRFERGDLIDVSQYAGAVGFVFPVALTREVWEALVDIQHDWPLMERTQRAAERRILEILLRALHAVRGVDVRSDAAQFCLYRFTSEAEREKCGRIAIRNDLRVHCGPGDSGEAVITISLLGSR